MVKILDQNRAIMERLTSIETSLAKSEKCGKKTVDVPLEVRVSYFQLLNHVIAEKRINAKPLICVINFNAFYVLGKSYNFYIDCKPCESGLQRSL